MENIAIVGKGGFGREVRMLIDQINAVTPKWNFLGYYDDDKIPAIDGFPSLGFIDKIMDVKEKLHVVIAIGDSKIRANIQSSILNENVFFPSLIHPNFQMDFSFSTLGNGSIVCGNNIVTTNVTIGDFIILNLGSTIGHDVTIGDFCSIMPGVNVSGNVNIGRNCFIGTGAKIINNVNIGDNVTIGAGSIVIKNIPDFCTVVGNPAKIIKIGNGET